MFQFIGRTVRALERARQLSQIAKEYSDSEELREKLLAVIHGPAADAECRSEEECRRIAA